MFPALFFDWDSCVLFHDRLGVDHKFSHERGDSIFFPGTPVSAIPVFSSCGAPAPPILFLAPMVPRRTRSL
eukprot:7151226-Heterocapsa_arctica.AAC.1